MTANFYFLKRELLDGDWTAAKSAMKVNWIVAEICLPFHTFHSLKFAYKS